MFNFEGDLRLTADGVHFGNPLQIRLLQEIERTGSITNAAKAVPMSYKAAWDAVNSMNNLSTEPLVVRVTGGKGGGGTRLTERGQQLVKHFGLIQEAHSAFLRSMSEYSQNFEADINLLQQLRFQTSARNQLSGRVVKIESYGIHEDIYFDIGADKLLKASITAESQRLLNLEIGKQCILLIKAPSIEVLPLDDAQYRGEIVECKAEADGVEVTLKVGDQTLIATTNHLALDALVVGEHVGVQIDPKNIILVIV